MALKLPIDFPAVGLLWPTPWSEINTKHKYSANPGLTSEIEVMVIPLCHWLNLHAHSMFMLG